MLGAGVVRIRRQVGGEQSGAHYRVRPRCRSERTSSARSRSLPACRCWLQPDPSCCPLGIAQLPMKAKFAPDELANPALPARVLPTPTFPLPDCPRPRFCAPMLAAPQLSPQHPTGVVNAPHIGPDSDNGAPVVTQSHCQEPRQLRPGCRARDTAGVPLPAFVPPGDPGRAFGAPGSACHGAASRAPPC